MKAPRRIFRSQAVPRIRLTRPVLIAGLAASALGLVTAGLSTNLFGRTPPTAERLSAGAASVIVVDGGTLRLGTQVVRLRGVDAPSRLDLCQDGRDCGGAAAGALSALVRDRPVDCRLAGWDRQGRPFADCQAGGADLGRAIVANGWARAGSNAPDLAELELRAREAGRGLWEGKQR